MNYYEHHIKDYAAATSHLSWDEDMAYTRFLRYYYRKEQPIPADTDEACRIVSAKTKVQREAVAVVLNEFFELREDGWHKDTCDEAIAAFQAGAPERELKKKNEDTRLARHRAERAELFKKINEAGQHAPWNTSTKELREMVKKLPNPATPPATAPDTQTDTLATPPATGTATPATATQTPDTRHQTPDTINQSSKAAQSSSESDGGGPETGSAAPPAYEQLATQLQKAGVTITSSHPNVIAWVGRGVTGKQAADAIAIARQRKPDGPIPANYLVPIIEEILNPPAASTAKTSGAWRFSDEATLAKGKELGIEPNVGEFMEPYRARLSVAIERRRAEA